MDKDYTAEIRRWEEAYARVDADTTRRKQRIAAKLNELRRKARML